MVKSLLRPSIKEENTGGKWEIDSWMTNGSVLSVGPQDILVGDRAYVSGKWSHLAALTFLPWAAPGSSATSSRTYD